MLKVRLQRVGRKNQPFFRIVVIESTFKQGGSPVEIIGTYNPLLSPKKAVTLEKYRLQYWLEKGAQMSTGAQKILLSVDEKKKIWPDKQAKTAKKDGAEETEKEGSEKKESEKEEKAEPEKNTEEAPSEKEDPQESTKSDKEPK